MLELNTLLQGRYRVLAIKSEQQSVVSYEAYDGERSVLVRLWAWPYARGEQPLSVSLASFFADSGLLRPVLLDSFTTEGIAVAVVDTRRDETAVARFDSFVRRAELSSASSTPQTPLAPALPMTPTVASGEDLHDTDYEPMNVAPEPAPADNPLPVWEPPDQGATAPLAKPQNRRWIYILGGAGFVMCCLVPLCCLLLSSAFTPQLEQFTDEMEARLTPTVPAQSFPDNGSSNVDGEAISIFDVEIGDCLNESVDGLTSEVIRVSCATPHTHEVFGVISYANGGAEYPGDDTLSAFADAECEMAFEEYVGLDFLQSELYFTTLYPSPDTWGNGDRVIDCLLYDPDAMLEGSMHDSFR